MKSEDARRRYWARNYVGWTTFSQSEPNDAHKIVRKWELDGKVETVVTQNVDRLHHKAGTKAIELHGTGSISLRNLPRNLGSFRDPYTCVSNTLHFPSPHIRLRSHMLELS